MDESDSIDLFAKYKDWIAVKKLQIKSDTSIGEVVYQLSSIRDAVSNKAFDLVDIDRGMLDQYADKLTAGMRKSYQHLSSVLALLGKEEARRVINDACKGKKEFAGIAETYLLRKIMGNLGFSTEIDREHVVAAYPETKIPKPPGRFGKAKKKE